MDNFLISIGEAEYKLSAEQIAGLDLIETGDRSYHLLHEGQAYHCELLGLEMATKTMDLRINGKKFQLQLADRYDQMVKKMGLTVATAQAGNDVYAPMPGLILDIMVQPGDEIEAGSTLLILEAMKMENVIKSEGVGVVKEIHVEKGATVDKGQMLIEMA